MGQNLSRYLSSYQLNVLCGQNLRKQLLEVVIRYHDRFNRLTHGHHTLWLKRPSLCLLKVAKSRARLELSEARITLVDTLFNFVCLDAPFTLVYDHFDQRIRLNVFKDDSANVDQVAEIRPRDKCSFFFLLN